ncbi:vitamin B12-dependent ribonucleotide reductase [archaeon]|jgi:ribonucleoside-diphosphate reductase alpha chain|nr:vitamin B12-dependent ribonucleotide reductase [archaeon]MBT4416602.1 vitamin B12-dependent ribonucleotide reductase [archaeon]
MISQIKKRDEKVVDFNITKVESAIFRAAKAVGGTDRDLSMRLANKVKEELDQRFIEEIPDVEEVQDTVEKVLIEDRHVKTAKAYILYRAKRAEERKESEQTIEDMRKSAENLNFTDNAIRVLERRYLLKDGEGVLIENPKQLVWRISTNIAKADHFYGDDPTETAEDFYDMIKELEFLPNSPTLMNAGTDLQQLSACFVLPVEDSMEGIFDAIKNTAMVHKSGGGTGFSFSRLRPSGNLVRSTSGVASGPISFMKVFDSATDVIKQGGKRRGANMGILRVDHPDVIDFINCKNDMTTLTNFNISVAVTDKFMEAVLNDSEYDLINPKTSKVDGVYKARNVFNMMVQNAWKNGDPGIVFIDEINRKHPAKNLGELESTNPCGEQPLLPYESCNLGSINLHKFIRKDREDMDWDRLEKCVKNGVHFLDNVIDMNKLPLKQIQEMSCKTRKVGLGIMGFADLLYELGIPYDSEEGLAMAEKLMKFVKDKAYEKSMELADKRGVYSAWEGSEHHKEGRRMRNATCITIAPTGTISMIGEASSGCEPTFAISYIKNVMDNTELVYTNKVFEKIAKERMFHTPELMKKIAQAGTIQGFDEIPEDVKKVFVCAQDITPEWHIRMQAAFQKHTDNGISKTVNFPNNATIDDVEQVYILAYQLNCKGVTIYRDGCRENQVLNIGSVNKKKKEMEKAYEDKKEKEKLSKAELLDEGKCPECSSSLAREEGCAKCYACGFSVCNA